MNQTEKLKARLATASPDEVRELIATLETAPRSQSEQPEAPVQTLPASLRFTAEQAKLWRPLAEGRARAIVVEQPERKVE